MEEMQAFDLMQKCEQQSYDYSVSELKLVFKSQTNQVLLRKFQEAFKKDSEGKNHHWPSVQKEKIKEIFD